MKSLLEIACDLALEGNITAAAQIIPSACTSEWVAMARKRGVNRTTCMLVLAIVDSALAAFANEAHALGYDALPPAFDRAIQDLADARVIASVGPYLT